MSEQQQDQNRLIAQRREKLAAKMDRAIEELEARARQRQQEADADFENKKTERRSLFE